MVVSWSARAESAPDEGGQRVAIVRRALFKLLAALCVAAAAALADIVTLLAGLAAGNQCARSGGARKLVASAQTELGQKSFPGALGAGARRSPRRTDQDGLFLAAPPSWSAGEAQLEERRERKKTRSGLVPRGASRCQTGRPVWQIHRGPDLGYSIKEAAS